MQTELTDQVNRLKTASSATYKSFFPEKLKSRRWRLALVLSIYVIYLLIGAAIFSAIETPPDLQTASDLRVFRQNFLYKHQSCLSDVELEQLILRVVEASKKGVSAVRNVSSPPNWSFGQSVFFSGTLVSTVGYGHVSPVTQVGKFFTIIYALVGIPLTLSLLTALVDRLKVPSLWCLGVLNSRLGHLYQPGQIRFLHLLMLAGMILVLLFFLPAAIFTSLEPGWTFLDSFYYCFVSLTTIGLGDYIPGDQPDQPNRPAYKFLITVYLMIGLCCMMLLLSTVYDIPQLNLRHFFIVGDEQQSYNDPERLQLASKGIGGPKYTQQVDDPTPPNASPNNTPAHHYMSNEQRSTQYQLY